ncbi:MAG: SHOCT domain-containing protein [Raoultibacter sp.]
MDKIKLASSDLAQQAQTKVENNIAVKMQKHEEKQITKKEIRNLQNLFSATNNMGDISIDSKNCLFKVKHASSSIKKKSGIMAKTGKVVAASMTAGASIAIEQAMKPNDKVFSFSELLSFELLEDDAQVVGGGVGMALVGGAFFGVGGAIAGAMTGGKKTKKTVENLALKINLNDIDFPCVIITYINKSTKISSNEYRKAISVAHETISCLKLIIDSVSANSNEARAEKTHKSAQLTTDSVDAIVKLKQLLDMGIITQEEFDSKKEHFLG